MLRPGGHVGGCVGDTSMAGGAVETIEERFMWKARKVSIGEART